MILALDIGNTNIVIGCSDKGKIRFIERLSTVHTKTELEYALDINLGIGYGNGKTLLNKLNKFSISRESFAEAVDKIEDKQDK